MSPRGTPYTSARFAAVIAPGLAFAVFCAVAPELLADRPLAGMLAGYLPLIAVLVAATTTAAFAASARRRFRQGGITSWALVASAMFLGTCSLLVGLVDGIGRGRVLLSGPAGILYLAAHAPFVLGVFLFPMRRLSGRERMTLALNGASTVLAGGVTVLVLIVFPRVSAIQAAGSLPVFLSATVGLSLALLAVVVEVFLIGGFVSAQPPLALLLVSAAFNIAADVAFVVNLMGDTYAPGGAANTLSLVSVVLVIAAAVMEMPVHGIPRPVLSTNPVQRSLPLQTGIEHSPMLWIVGMFLLLVWEQEHPIPGSRTLLHWASLVAVLLVLARASLDGYGRLVMVRKVRAAEEALQHTNAELEHRVLVRTAELQKALDDIRTLKGLLPICASCKKICDSAGRWHQLESYLLDQGNIRFSHGLCPECLAKFEAEGSGG
jgi:hypothetical protein